MPTEAVDLVINCYDPIYMRISQHCFLSSSALLPKGVKMSWLRLWLLHEAGGGRMMYGSDPGAATWQAPGTLQLRNRNND